MSVNDLFLPLMILTCCLAILMILVIILYCRTLKYIRTHSEVFVTTSENPESLEKCDTEVIETPKQVSNNNETLDIAEEFSAPEPVPAPSVTNLFGLSTMQPTEEVDIIQAANDAIERLAPFAEAQNIKIHLSTTCEELMVMGIPESIRILFRNIIDNSIKYMGRAGHMIITISLLGDDIFVILKDTGKGLNEEETSHIFELNFQGSNRVSGNGLGLTQSKMIVEAFGGTIYAKSSPENGMAIYIQLPVSKKENTENL